MKIFKYLLACVSGISVFMLGTLVSHAEVTPESVHAAVAAAKKAPKNKVLNREAGDALRDAGFWEESFAYYAKGDNLANLGAAESAYYLYEFEKAREYLDKYLEKRTKAEEQKEDDLSYGPESDPVSWSEYLGTRIDLGRAMLDRVEKIQIIDSVNVSLQDFYEYVRLARSAGSLQGDEVASRIVPDNTLDSLGLVEIVAPAYLSESGDDMIWVGGTQDGDTHVYESSRLSDGSWDAPMNLFDYKSIFGTSDGTSVISPFLLPDGVTLYFAADGSESLGGLDIFMSRRDDNGFLQPSNIGMPYNSPYNDYLYAVDESTGAGWWVTDRNGLTDSVTVYTFIPQDLRINYDVDAPGLVSFARVDAISDTWTPGADYSDLKDRLARVKDDRMSSLAGGVQSDFDFAMPDGRVLHRLSDFRSALARSSAQELFSTVSAAAVLASKLEQMRLQYAAGDKGLAPEILAAERRLEQYRSEIKEMRNHVVSSEL